MTRFGGLTRCETGAKIHTLSNSQKGDETKRERFLGKFVLSFCGCFDFGNGSSWVASASAPIPTSAGGLLQ